MAVVYLNERFVQAERAKVSAFDRGFSYGDGLFETMRAYSGWVFALERHLERLRKGAVQIGIPFDEDVPRWRRVMDALLRRNGLQAGDSSLRLTLSRGADMLGSLLPPEPAPSPTVLVVAKPLEEGISERQRLGISAIALRWGSPFNPFGVKSLNYFYNMLAMAQARQEGAQEALFVAPDGSVVEGTTSNVFSVLDGILTTPAEDSGLLPGITREVVIELARKEGLTVRGAPVFLDELFSADEAFMTGSLKEVMPLTRIDGRTIGDGCVGPVTRLLQERYRGAVEEERGQGVRAVRGGRRGARP